MDTCTSSSLTRNARLPWESRSWHEGLCEAQSWQRTCQYHTLSSVRLSIRAYLFVDYM